MRLPIIPPADLSAEQKPIYDDMRDGIARNFQGFVNIRDDGALLGPWNPWIHEPKFGKPVWELTKAMVSNPSLPANVREVAILVTGAHFKSAYELYAHVIVAEHRGLSDEKLATIVAGPAAGRPDPAGGGRLRLRPGRRRSPSTSPRRWSTAAYCRNSRIGRRSNSSGSTARRNCPILSACIAWCR